MKCLTNISESDVIAAVKSARKRVVFLAPGLSEAVAAVLTEAWQRLPPEAVSVILDVDPEIIRLGYGTLEGLKQIQEAAALHGQLVCHQPGVRISVVIADDTSLIFTPTPLLIEAGSNQPNQPNGIHLTTPPPSLSDELGIGPDSYETRTIGLNTVPAATVEQVSTDLKANPPLKFDISRKERVFNAKLEFVEFELEGCFISRHTVAIPSDLVRLSKMDKKTRSKLRSSFKLIDASDMIDAKKKVSEKALAEARGRIQKKYLISIKGYGSVILRSNREAFEKEVEDLRAKVVQFHDALSEKLEGIYEANATRLTKALLPAIAKKPPEDWTSILGVHPTKEDIEKKLYRTLLDSFGPPEALLKEMRVNLVFKGITYTQGCSKVRQDM
ncbi:MAG: hypothetical protein O2960_22055 [Verrucomicrobia bacterium]|nr:hypothetical protein [Verrucomicrobiota bacterium]